MSNMIDVDFRFVGREIPFGENAPRMYLQWRKRIIAEVFDVAVKYEKWTKWEDVRTEEE